MLKQLIHDKIDEIFLEMQDRESITDGGIEPFDALYLEELEQQLEQVISNVLNYQRGGNCTMKAGDLIASNGDLYDYIGFDKEARAYKASIVEIDDDGNLTNTHITCYLSAEELTKGNKPNFTKRQWCGIVETLIRNDYDLTEEEIETAAEDIVYREFAILGVPTVEELNRRIETYMNR